MEMGERGADVRKPSVLGIGMNGPAEIRQKFGVDGEGRSAVTKSHSKIETDAHLTIPLQTADNAIMKS
jgi:hypothetical protein